MTACGAKSAQARRRTGAAQTEAGRGADAQANARIPLPAFLNVAVNTVSQWERGERHPTGAALKLLHVVKRNGIQALQ
jgi:transcriptional regulator with XRE-family HTH domain